MATKLTFNQMMNSRKSDGSLRNAHVAILRVLSKANSPCDLTKLAKDSDLGPRMVSPAIHFLCSEGLAKEQVIEDAGKSFSVTSKGRKTISVAEKSASKTPTKEKE